MRTPLENDPTRHEGVTPMLEISDSRPDFVVIASAAKQSIFR
jgi:hypothetical protein